MDSMRDGMVEVQDGFFYNKLEKMMSGIKKVEDTLSVDKKKLLPENKAHMIGMATNTSIKIQNSLKKMKTAINSKQFAVASEEYTNIVNSCTQCHKVVRGW